MPAKLSINDVDVAGKRVFMRVDFNVPQECKSFLLQDNLCSRIVQSHAKGQGGSHEDH